MAKHRISNVSSVGIAGKTLEVKDGVLDVPDEMESHPEWVRLRGELVEDPAFDISQHSEKGKDKK